MKRSKVSNVSSSHVGCVSYCSSLVLVAASLALLSCSSQDVTSNQSGESSVSQGGRDASLCYFAGLAYPQVRLEVDRSVSGGALAWEPGQIGTGGKGRYVGPGTPVDRLSGVAFANVPGDYSVVRIGAGSTLTGDTRWIENKFLKPRLTGCWLSVMIARGKTYCWDSSKGGYSLEVTYDNVKSCERLAAHTDAAPGGGTCINVSQRDPTNAGQFSCTQETALVGLPGFLPPR
jgi:hypothetical protein